MHLLSLFSQSSTTISQPTLKTTFIRSVVPVVLVPRESPTLSSLQRTPSQLVNSLEFFAKPSRRSQERSRRWDNMEVEAEEVDVDSEVVAEAVSFGER